MMSNLPKISVVIPSYNQEAFLEQTLVSVLGQNYPNLELFVLDGGSKDGSVEIIKRYADRIHFWRSQRDGGQAAALADGFSKCTGEILCWVNSDDFLAEGSLQAVADFFMANPQAEVVVGDICLTDVDGNPIQYISEPKWNLNWQVYVRNCMPQPSVFWKRSLYSRVAGVRPELRFAMDYDLWFQFVKQTNFHFIHRLLSFQRQHDATKSSTMQDVATVEKPRVARNYFPQLPPVSNLRRYAWKAHRVAFRTFTGSYLRGLRGKIREEYDSDAVGLMPRLAGEFARRWDSRKKAASRLAG